MRIARVSPVLTNRDSFAVPECHPNRPMQLRMRAVRMTEASEESRSVKALINKLGLEGF